MHVLDFPVFDGRCCLKIHKFLRHQICSIASHNFFFKPCTAKIFRRCPIMATDVVERRMATSGQRVQASSQTNKLSPEGKSPQRSMCTSRHGLSGVTVGRSGSALDLSATDLQGIQAFTIVSTWYTMPGHHTFSLIICLVRTIPWCPSCAFKRVAYQRILGITIWEPHRMTPFLAHIFNPLVLFEIRYVWPQHHSNSIALVVVLDLPWSHWQTLQVWVPLGLH